MSVAALDYVNRELQGCRDLESDAGSLLCHLQVKDRLNSVSVIPVSSLQWIQSGEDRLAHETNVPTRK